MIFDDFYMKIILCIKKIGMMNLNEFRKYFIGYIFCVSVFFSVLFHSWTERIQNKWYEVITCHLWMEKIIFILFVFYIKYKI